MTESLYVFYPHTFLKDFLADSVRLNTQQEETGRGGKRGGVDDRKGIGRYDSMTV